MKRSRKRANLERALEKDDAGRVEVVEERGGGVVADRVGHNNKGASSRDRTEGSIES